MAKFYFKDLRELKRLNPKQKNIDFLLAYSQALKVITYRNLKFEILQN